MDKKSKILATGMSCLVLFGGAFMLGKSQSDDSNTGNIQIESQDMSSDKDNSKKSDKDKAVTDTDKKVEENKQQAKDTEKSIEKRMEERNKAIDEDPDAGKTKNGTRHISPPKFPVTSTNSDKAADFHD